MTHLGGCEAEYIAGLREAVRQGLVAGPTILTAGRALSPTSGGGGARVELRDGAEVFRKAVREILADGANLIMLLLTSETPTERTPLSDEEFGVIVDEAHRVGARVACQAAGLRPSKAALRAGVDLLLLGPTELDAECLEMLASGKTAWAPALSTRTELGTESDALGSAVKAVHARGGTIVVGTGWRGGERYPFAAEVSALMEAGVSPAAAMAAGTTRGAQALGLGDASVGPGKRASLVALSSDPRKDPSILGDPDQVSLILYAEPRRGLSWRKLLLARR